MFLRDLFPDSFSSALGLQSFFRVTIAFIIPVICGYLKQYFGDLSVSMLFLAIFTITTVILWTIVEFIRKLKK